MKLHRAVKVDIIHIARAIRATNMTSDPLSQQQQDTADRDEVARLSRNEMLRLSRDYKLFIKLHEFSNWRPTKREVGDIPGVMDGLEIIATDGLLAYFRFVDPNIDPQNSFFGHIQFFTGEVKPMFSTAKDKDFKFKSAKVKKPKPTLLERALNLLASNVLKIEKDGKDVMVE